MGLKAPGIVTFMLSVILTVTVLIIKFFGAEIPFHRQRVLGFCSPKIILVLGCIMRGLRPTAQGVRCALVSRGTQRPGGRGPDEGFLAA
jgi:hypothetical protein